MGPRTHLGGSWGAAPRRVSLMLNARAPDIASDDEYGEFPIPVKVGFVPIDGGTPACGINTDGIPGGSGPVVVDVTPRDI